MENFISFGATLKAAREAKGLTIAQLAEKTRIMSTIIDELEHDDFHRLPAPIYGRGFIRLYCETVGIDAKPLIAEYMEIVNGNRTTTIRERNEAPQPLPTSAQPIAPAKESVAPTATEPPIPQTSPFEQKPIEPPAPQKIEQHDLLGGAPDRFEPPRFTSYSEPIADRFEDLSTKGPIYLRWALLGIAGLLILWALFAGIGALYRATSTPAEKTVEPKTVETLPPPSTADASTAAPRKPIKIPPLYMK